MVGWLLTVIHHVCFEDIHKYPHPFFRRCDFVLHFLSLMCLDFDGMSHCHKYYLLRSCSSQSVYTSNGKLWHWTKKRKKKYWINTQKLLIKIEILFSLKKKKERKKGIPLESNNLPTPYVTNFPLQTKTLPCISQISHYEQKLFPNRRTSHKSGLLYFPIRKIPRGVMSVMRLWVK